MRLFLLTTLLLILILAQFSRAVPVDGDHDGEDENEDDNDTAEDEEQEEEEDDGDDGQEDDEKKKTVVVTEETEKGPLPLGPSKFYHNLTKQSFEALTQGPCLNNLLFLKASARPDEKYGECDCHQYIPRGSESYVPLVYHHASQRCYHLYTQAYCKNSTQWIVFTDRDRVGCVPNPCVDPSFAHEKVVLLDGKCVELGEDCPSPKDTNYIVAFRPFDVSPSCSQSVIVPVVNFAAGGGIIGCPRGQRPLPSGECLPIFVV